MSQRIVASLLALSATVLPACDAPSQPGPTPPSTGVSAPSATADAAATMAAPSPPDAAGPAPTATSSAEAPAPNAQVWKDCFPPGYAWSSQGTRLLGVALGPDYPKVIDVKTEFPLADQGAALAGKRVRGKLRCTTPGLTIGVDARILEAVTDPAPGGQARWVYDVELLTPGPGEGTWVKACPADGTTKGQALALPGTWDSKGVYQATPGTFSFACTVAVAAKCVRQWSYLPGSELHLACTRMARADYCGRDESQTQDGTPVGVWDTDGVSPATPPAQRPPNAHFEAAWTSRGAVCMDHPRWPDQNPQCAAALPRCNSEKAAKALGDAGSAKLVFNASCTPDPGKCAAAKN
jgi:hypothetical protein